MQKFQHKDDYSLFWILASKEKKHKNAWEPLPTSSTPEKLFGILDGTKRIHKKMLFCISSL
jgi:hypothetical protein